MGHHEMSKSSVTCNRAIADDLTGHTDSYEENHMSDIQFQIMKGFKAITSTLNCAFKHAGNHMVKGLHYQSFYTSYFPTVFRGCHKYSVFPQSTILVDVTKKSITILPVEVLPVFEWGQMPLGAM